jgi:AcrR family transcriptional regulator
MAEQVARRDADRSRAAILDAAEHLFAEHGFDAVTLAQIGARAGVSRGTPGYFFGTKEALYRVVVERAAATLRAFAETLRTRDGSGSRSRDSVTAETVEAFLALLLARRSVVRLIDRESGVGLMEGQPHAEAVHVALSALGSDAPRAALTILSLCWFPLSHPNAARTLGLDPDAPDFADRWRPHVAAALTASQIPDPSPASAGSAGAPAEPDGESGSHDPDPDFVVDARKKKKKGKKKGRKND